MIDGEISLDEIKDQFEAQFPPQKIKLEELGNFVGTLHQQRTGALRCTRPGRATQKTLATSATARNGCSGFRTFSRSAFAASIPRSC